MSSRASGEATMAAWVTCEPCALSFSTWGTAELVSDVVSAFTSGHAQGQHNEVVDVRVHVPQPRSAPEE